jgi:hypothetical protein
MASERTPVGIGKRRDSEAVRHHLAGRRGRLSVSTALAGGWLALLSACAPTLPTRPPSAEAAARPANEEPAARLTVYEAVCQTINAQA